VVFFTYWIARAGIFYFTVRSAVKLLTARLGSIVEEE